MKYLQIIVVLLALLCIFSSCNRGDSQANIKIENSVYQKKSPKRGVSFGFSFTEDVRVLSKAISWYYNWSPTQADKYDEVVKDMNLDFCPMAWNSINSNVIREYVDRHPQCKYLLTFNEPNLKDQANMTPHQAALKWPEIKSIANELGLKLISPAMNYGTLRGFEDPIVWLDEFFKLVPLSDVEGISVHCYMADPGALKWYLNRFKKYNKPLWLTEFCAWDGLNENQYSTQEQERFMSDAINYLECDSMVFRYAWFIPRGEKNENEFPYNFLLKNSSCFELTDLGKIFTQLSTQDTSTYYRKGQTIEAEHYSSISISEGVGTNDWVNGPGVRITKDKDESLELYEFLKNHWVEYKIDVDQSWLEKMEIRYACRTDAKVILGSDDGYQTSFELFSTGGDSLFQTALIPVSLKKGKQTIRIKIDQGATSINWFRFY